ncbi:endoglucanase [candidate division LCP-89 bacterium B3_LCP]|uniref:Endoglucanase n=1 Tax=candidate division LCP-89 bacterium B3_LCP TaxID=2012998 RepID=A0A532V2Z2_UNCL8|nr:MAG: endoglucanase [candidate division LCP-89 bacterium B3_LCP]
MELLKRLTAATGISGHEDDVRSLIIDEMKPLVEKVNTDVMGNVIGYRKGKTNTKLVIAAHMDEIGFMVNHVDDNGFLRIIPLGGFDPRTLMAQKVVVHGKKELNGIFGSKPVHVLSDDEKKKVLKVTDYHIDLGLPADKVKKLVSPGDTVTWHRDFTEVGDCFTSKAFDDRVGVYVMLEALRKVKGKALQVDLYAVATVQEEVGVRGATTSAIGIDPDIGVAVDITLANDIPGASDHEKITKLGEGAAIKIMDSYSISNPKLFEHFKAVAKKHKIKTQVEILPRGGTDAGAIQRAGSKAAVITISIPTRYAHSTVETIHKEDVKSCINLVAAFILEAGSKKYIL